MSAINDLVAWCDANNVHVTIDRDDDGWFAQPWGKGTGDYLGEGETADSAAQALLNRLNRLRVNHHEFNDGVCVRCGETVRKVYDSRGELFCIQTSLPHDAPHEGHKANA
jgi:hypothetical protein